jgi:hypothetical protein
MQGTRRLQRPRFADDSLRRGPSASIPRAKCFEGDTKRGGAVRLGQLEPDPNLPQD